MARFLFATFPFPGFVEPAVPVAETLMDRGHEVYWYTGNVYKKTVESAGAEYLPYETARQIDYLNYHEILPQNRQLVGPREINYWLKHVYLDSVEGHFTDLCEIHRHIDIDMVVTDPMCWGAMYFAERKKLPFAAVNFSPLSCNSIDTEPFGRAKIPTGTVFDRLRNRVLHWVIDYILLHDIQVYTNRTRARLGLPELRCHFIDYAYEQSALFIQGTVPEFEYPRSDLPQHVHFVGPLLGREEERFRQPSWWDDLTGERPVILLTQGILENMQDLYMPVINSLSTRNVIVVALTNNHDLRLELPHIPKNLRIGNDIPLEKIMPHVSVLVTNGGYKDVQSAMWCGVPVIMTGRRQEQRELAARVEWARVGINLKTTQPDFELIRDSIDKVLEDPQYRNNALKIRSEYLKYNSSLKSAALLERVTKTGRSVLRSDLHETVEDFQSRVLNRYSTVEMV